jgi:putative phosphoribosyl transferase
MIERAVLLPAGRAELAGDLVVPEGARGVVVFAHGSGSGRGSPRNRLVAAELLSAALGTLLVDLLTAEEDEVDRRTGEVRFDVALLGERVAQATDWLADQSETAGLVVGFFGASTGAGAALVAAAERPERVGAVVSRGGRPDLAGAALGRVRAPTLLIVGGDDTVVLELNEQARAQMQAPTELEVVPGASHLFEEPGALDEVARLARGWFQRYLRS